MVRRSSDAPRNPGDRISDNSDRLDEVTKAVSRGSQALRNDAGHILNLNPESPNPLLVPTGGNNDIDSALKFQDGGLEVRSPDGDSFRDFGARGGFFRGALNVNGAIEAGGRIHTTNEVRSDGGMRAEAGLSCGGNFAAGGSISGGTTTVGPLFCNTINATGDINAPGRIISTDPNGLMRSLSYQGGVFHGVFDNQSDRRLKRDHRPVSPSDLQQLLNAPVTTWEYRDDVETDVTLPAGRRVGMVAQDAPAVLRHVGDDGYLGLDLSSTVGMLHALVQQLAAEVADLRQQIDQRGQA